MPIGPPVMKRDYVTKELNYTAVTGSSGMVAEMVYTNENEGDTAFTMSQSAPSWATSIDLQFDRVLDSGDDDKMIMLDLRLTVNGEQVHISETFNAGYFRNFAAFSDTTGHSVPSDYYAFANTLTRTTYVSLGTFAHAGTWIVARNERSDGRDIMRLRLTDSNQQSAYSDVYATVRLVT